MSRFDAFADKMTTEGLPQIVVETFKHYYGQLVEGATGMIPEDDLAPLTDEDVVDHAGLADLVAEGERVLPHTAIVKLNGGLGTSMGLAKAKSLLPVKEGLSFLDCTALQISALRKTHGANVPFVLMNSFSTDDDSREALAKYPELGGDLPLSFLQHKFPKVMREGYGPAQWSTDANLEWNPPGHGDIYPALVSSGMLKAMRERGIRYLFISNSDNLGASLDLGILGHFASTGLDFAMEVARRTEMDSKGGHLARVKAGGLALRESAQCLDQDKKFFQDISLHRYFNTNNLWLNLEALEKALQEKGGFLPLPLIVNPKTLDPRDPSSPPVYQLETAMGAAICVFDNVGAVVVPRSRFCPVKKCSDLLSVWSDRYLLNEDYRVVPNPAAKGSITIDLDSDTCKLVSDFEKRFPHGAPSLVDCTRLTVEGDVTFGKDVVCVGDVTVTAGSGVAATVADGAKLEGSVDLS